MKDRNYPKDPERVMLSMKLVSLRKEYRINQYDLEQKLNLPRGSVSKIERGVRDPTWKEMNLFAELFHVSLDYLAGRTEITTPRSTDFFTYLRNHPFTRNQLAVLEDSVYEIRKKQDRPRLHVQGGEDHSDRSFFPDRKEEP